jgi:uncharacterized membrane protein YqhA
MQRVLSASRYLIMIAVLGSFIAATTLLIYGGLEAIVLVIDTIQSADISSKGAKTLALAFIEMVDVYLLGTVFYIIALGLYELFIDDLPSLPKWLVIRTLDDLKDKLIGVIIVVMGVLFLGQVVTWDGERNLLNLGGAIALVVAALTYFLSQKKRGKPEANPLQPDDE